MTKYYTINGLTVSRDEDIWSIPGLADDGGYLRPHAATVRIAEDGGMCHPMTSGAAAEQYPENTYPIEIGGDLRGWGEHDCERSYRAAGHAFSADVLEAVAKWSGLKLPVAAE